MFILYVRTHQLFMFVSFSRSSCRASSSSLLSSFHLVTFSVFLSISLFIQLHPPQCFWMPMYFFHLYTLCAFYLSLSPSHSLIDKSLPCLFERKTDSHSFAPCVSFSPSSLHSCLSFWAPLAEVMFVMFLSLPVFVRSQRMIHTPMIMSLAWRVKFVGVCEWFQIL